MISGQTISDTDVMDPHQLRTFVAVAGCGSFSAAAARLGYTQSAVSQQIAALEADLGTPVLHRRPVTPTEAGARLLDHAGPLLLRLDAARADVARAARAPSAHLALGASPLAAAEAAHALDAVPRLGLTVRVLARDAVVRGVATGAFDLGLVDGVAAPSDPLRLPDVAPLTAAAVAERELVVALPAGHPLARRPGLRLAELVDAGWVDAPDVAAPLPDLRAAAGYDGLRASMRYQGTDTATLLALIAAGHGLAVLPGPAVHGTDRVTGVPVTAPRLVHRTELVHGTITGPAAILAAVLKSG
jgi:DNA-binding transcriptional LysR family regulator